MMLRSAIFAIVVCLFNASWTAAQTVDATSMASLKSRVSDFETTFRAGNLGAVLDFLPPLLLESIAEQSGMTTQELRQGTRQIVENLLKEIDLAKIEFDMGLPNASYGVSSEDRNYAIMHSFTDFPGLGPQHTPILALMDKGVWYLVRIEGAQSVEFVEDTYPDLSNLDFTKAAK